MGKMKYYRKLSITIHGESCSQETWHKTHTWKGNTRHTKVTHLASGMTFGGFSESTYKHSESEAQNKAGAWIHTYLAQKRQQELARAEQERLRQALEAAKRKHAQEVREQRARQQALEAEQARLRQAALEQQRQHEQQLAEQRERQRNEMAARITLLRQNLSAKQTLLRAVAQKLSVIQRKIETEEALINRRFINMNHSEDANTRVVVIIGKTGSGKSTFCNRLMSDVSIDGDEGPFTVGGGGTSCTQNLSMNETTIGNTKLLFVDTPGFGDTGGAEKDRQHGNKVCKYLKGSSGINSFVLIRNTATIRFEPSIQQMFTHYATMFGDDFYSNLIIVGTKVDYSNRKFLKDKMDASLRNEIPQQFRVRRLSNSNNDTVPIPVIPIGTENYKDPLLQFVHAIPASKFTCAKIKSPIDGLRSEESQIGTRRNCLQQEINTIQNNVSSVQQQLEQL